MQRKVHQSEEATEEQRKQDEVRLKREEETRKKREEYKEASERAERQRNQAEEGKKDNLLCSREKTQQKEEQFHVKLLHRPRSSRCTMCLCRDYAFHEPTSSSQQDSCN